MSVTMTSASSPWVADGRGQARATDAIVRGIDLMTIATLMGHKDLTMLTRIYQHLNLKCDHLKAAMRQITDAGESDAA